MKIDLKDYAKQWEAFQRDMPEIMKILTLNEGLTMVKYAKTEVNKVNRINTGQYINGFHTGRNNSGYKKQRVYDRNPPRAKGSSYEIDVYNNVEHAIHNEYGTRAHFVPGRWEGKTFVYDPGAKSGQMMPEMTGIYALTKAERLTKMTQQRRVERRLAKFVVAYLEGKTYQDVKL